MTDGFRFPPVNTVYEACKLLRISRSSYYQLIATGKLRTFTIGRKRLATGEALAELVRNEEAGK
jgi:excisionase family DNA binding protein